MVQKERALLRHAIPAFGVFLIGFIKIGIGPQRGQKGGLIIGATAHPTVNDPLPLGDGVPSLDHFVPVAAGFEKFVRITARAGICLTGQDIFGLRRVQGIIHAGNHARAVAEGRMGGHIFDLLAINPNLSPIAQAFQILCAV